MVIGTYVTLLTADVSLSSKFTETSASSWVTVWACGAVNHFIVVHTTCGHRMLAYSGQLPRDWFACSWRASSVSEARLTVSKNWLDGAGLPCVPPSGLRFKAVFEL